MGWRKDWGGMGAGISPIKLKMLKYFWCFSSPWIWTKRRGRVYIGKALLLPLQKVEEVLKSTLYIEAKVISLCVFFAIPPFCKGSYKLRELGGPQKEGKMIENRWFVEKMTRFLMHFWSKLMKNRWKWRVSFCFFERHSWKIDENGLFPFVVLSDIAQCPCMSPCKKGAINLSRRCAHRNFMKNYGKLSVDMMKAKNYV